MKKRLVLTGILGIVLASGLAFAVDTPTQGTENGRSYTPIPVQQANGFGVFRWGMNLASTIQTAMSLEGFEIENKPIDPEMLEEAKERGVPLTDFDWIQKFLDR